MALGIETNNLAPQLIADSGAALVQGIRQIGQQISGHLTEIQTKRDLGAMAQEMQGLNVQSNEFPVQLTQMLQRHPLAAKDERGQMALSILGKAHGQWQAGEAEARAFNRAMAMQGYRNRAAREEFDYEESVRGKRPVSVAGVGLVSPREIDPVTGQAKVLAPAAARPGSNRPLVLGQGAKAIDINGNVIAANPKLAPALTPGQQISNSRMEKKNKIDLLMRQDTSLRTEIAAHEKRLDATMKAVQGVTDPTEKNALLEQKNAIIEQANQLKAQREKLKNVIQNIEKVPASDALNAVPAGQAEVLPPVDVITAAAPSAEMVMVIDPNGRPGRIKASQLEAALQNGYKRR